MGTCKQIVNHLFNNLTGLPVITGVVSADDDSIDVVATVVTRQRQWLCSWRRLHHHSSTGCNQSKYTATTSAFGPTAAFSTTAAATTCSCCWSTGM